MKRPMRRHVARVHGAPGGGGTREGSVTQPRAQIGRETITGDANGGWPTGGPTEPRIQWGTAETG